MLLRTLLILIVHSPFTPRGSRKDVHSGERRWNVTPLENALMLPGRCAFPLLFLFLKNAANLPRGPIARPRPSVERSRSSAKPSFLFWLAACTFHSLTGPTCFVLAAVVATGRSLAYRNANDSRAPRRRKMFSKHTPVAWVTYQTPLKRRLVPARRRPSCHI